MSVRELNQQTSAVLKDVAAGRAVTITSDGRPIARLVPIGGGIPELLGSLVTSGRAEAATVSGPMPFPAAYEDEGRDVAAALAADRDLEPW